MAAQCRSPRCTAERKGFRRELDSWRHRLIHCVGFESILEGLYGPGLCKDLSLFDDCEPEELVDWCLDDKCSLCNLRKDKNDYTPSGDSAQSTPTGELISQGQFNTEKSECQAENYLNALFQKKDLPQNCDPNIPLVAQELMKKMIRQFAIEYISKSRKMCQQDSNGTIADNPLGLNGIHKKHADGFSCDEQDGPLDLTVARNQEKTLQDGVLDLSIKRNGSPFEENSKARNTKNGVMNGYFLRKMKKTRKLQKENTALFKVLVSCCLYHQQQLISMLKFLKKEQESCSQTCHSSGQSKSAEHVFRSPDNSLGTCQIRTNQKSTKSIKINEKIQQRNLPYLTIRLKDLRFTWPNLNLGTVKLNQNEKEDVHLTDQLLRCINTRSKKKKSVCYDCLITHNSTSQSKLPFSSSLSKFQRTGTDLKRTMIKQDFKCRCTQQGCQLEMTSKCYQTKADVSDGNDMTVMKKFTFKDSCTNNKQERLKPNRKNAQKNSLDSSTSSCVNFGSFIKHFLNSETNNFAELVNQKENSVKKKVRMGFHRNNEKISMFDSSFSECQTVDFSRELGNLTDTFPKEKNNFVKNLPNSSDDGIEVSVEHAPDSLVLKDCEPTETKSDVQEILTDLPHDTLKIPPETVNCIKNSQVFLPTNFKCAAPQVIVEEKPRGNKRHIVQDVHTDISIPPKRNSRNILGKCRLCDVSHGLHSFPNNNILFCKCTIQKNSGILKNFKTKGVNFRKTTEKNRNTHLKVVVKRLEDSKLLGNSTINGKHICKLNKTDLCNSNVKSSSYGINVPQKTLNIVKHSNCLNSTSIAQKICASVENTHEYVSNAVTETTSDNVYFSPIKLMFVSKVESEDGVKYTLSSEYTPVNKHTDVKVSDSVVKTRHTLNPESIQSGIAKNMGAVNQPKSKVNVENSSEKVLHCSDESNFERRTSRRKQCAGLVSKTIITSAEHPNEKCSQKNFAKAGSDIAIASTKTSKSKKPSSNKLGKSRFAKAYVQNESSRIQLRIKKVERFLRSSTRNLHIIESGSFQRISKRHKKLRKRSNVSGMCGTNGSFSQKGGRAHLSHFKGAISKYTKTKASDTAGKGHNQKKIKKRKFTRGSLLIRKLKYSNNKARTRKTLSTTFHSFPSSSFSVRSALCHKSKKSHHNKCRVYRRKLRSFKQQYKLPLKEQKCTVNKDENRTENIDFQPNTVLNWWSASTSKESLLKDLENKYEQIANTWLGENNGEIDNEAQSLSTLKFCSSETRSPVQMLFQKKCDMSDLAAWFMQTTETQPLSIVRKDNARSPLQKVNSKGPRTKAKKPSINSCSSKKHFKQCAQPTPSEALTELLNVSKISKSSKNPNMLKNVTDENSDVGVKFACLEKHVDVTKASAEKTSTNVKPPAKEIAQLPYHHLRNATYQGAAAVPTSIIHKDSLDGTSKKLKSLVQHKSKSKPKTIYMCCSSKQNIRDCKVFLTKLHNVESKASSSYRGPHSLNTIVGSKSTFKPEWKLKKGFTTKYCLRMNKSFSRSTCTFSRIQNSSKNCNFGMSLRKAKGPDAPYNSHPLILEKQNPLSKMTLYFETNPKRSKPQISKIGKIQSQCPKFQLGSIKPVGIPAIRGLSSKGGTYSLTPIRIPLK